MFEASSSPRAPVSGPLLSLQVDKAYIKKKKKKRQDSEFQVLALCLKGCGLSVVIKCPAVSLEFES